MDWPLFVSALLSATLLPGSSEALLIMRLGDGGKPLALLAAATLGNLLGSLITYVLGRMGNRIAHMRWLRIDPADVRRAEGWFQRWGWPTLLFAWLPVIGDPLCLVAGLLRVRLPTFVLLVGVGKLARYASLVWLFG